MRTTLDLDDDLLADARELTGLSETTDLVREAMKALIARESARRLAGLGGSQPHLASAQRRRHPQSKVAATAGLSPARLR